MLVSKIPPDASVTGFIYLPLTVTNHPLYMMSPLIIRHKPMKKAFTFIEILIYMGLVSVFLVVLANMFITLLDTQLETTGSSAVDQDGQSAAAAAHAFLEGGTAPTALSPTP